jgi:hypothetical protein
MNVPFHVIYHVVIADSIQVVLGLHSVSFNTDRS